MNKVKGYRVMAGYSQTEVADMLGLTKQTYCKRETGKTQFKPSEMLKLKNIISVVKPDITIDELFF